MNQRFRARKATGEVWTGSLSEVLRHADSVPAWLYEYPDIPKEWSTGLTDKHGKEIFENDVVLIHHHWDERMRNKKKVVHYDEGAFYPLSCGDWTPETDQVEVLGHVSQYPDLLPRP